MQHSTLGYLLAIYTLQIALLQQGIWQINENDRPKDDDKILIPIGVIIKSKILPNLVANGLHGG